MNASKVFQNGRRWVAVLLVAAALAVSTIGFLSADIQTTWDDIPALAGDGQDGIGNG